VSELGLRALASDDMQALLDDAVGLVAEILDVEMVGVAEILSDGGRLRLRAGVGWDPGAVGATTASAGRGSMVGYTVRAGEPVLSPDVGADRRFTPSQLLQDHGVVGAATVVIMGYDEPFGTLGVFSREPRTFSADEAHSLQAVANVISTATERAAVDRRPGKVREAERSRIARDLHDEALQGLTHALAVTGRSAPGRDDELFGILRGVSRQLCGAIYDLRIHQDPERRFADALSELVEVPRALASGCEVGLDAPDGLPEGAYGRRGIEVLRVIGEALTNARRHAAASRVVVRVTGPETRLCLEVTDNGRGYGAERPEGLHGHGVKGMRERAGMLDADLAIRSDETGPTVRLQANLSADSPTRTRVLLVEDHATVREALAAAFERHSDLEVVGQAASLAEARELLDGVDVAVIDLGLPDGSAPI
jgi:signal transduction histidine kinase